MPKFLIIFFLLICLTGVRAIIKGEYYRETRFVSGELPVKEFVILSGRHKVYLSRGTTSCKDIKKQVNGEQVCTLARWTIKKDTITIYETQRFKLNRKKYPKCLCKEQVMVIKKKYLHTKAGCLTLINPHGNEIPFCKMEKGE